MQKNPSVGCLVMAAGNARRFGDNKLAALVEGKTLIERALDAVPKELFTRVVVVTQYTEVESLAVERGLTVLWNKHPDWGISHTIRLGTTELQKDCGAICYMVSDQPLLKRESIAGAVDLYRRHPNFPTAASAATRAFSRVSFFPSCLSSERITAATPSSAATRTGCFSMRSASRS